MYAHSYDRKLRKKRTIQYFPLVALLLLFASTVLFWTGAAISALYSQDGTSISIAELHDYVSCLKPATQPDSASTCAEVLGENWKDSGLAPYLVTAALVIAVRTLPPVLIHATHRRGVS